MLRNLLYVSAIVACLLFAAVCGKSLLKQDAACSCGCDCCAKCPHCKPDCCKPAAPVKFSCSCRKCSLHCCEACKAKGVKCRCVNCKCCLACPGQKSGAIGAMPLADDEPDCDAAPKKAAPKDKKQSYRNALPHTQLVAAGLLPDPAEAVLERVGRLERAMDRVLKNWRGPDPKPKNQAFRNSLPHMRNIIDVKDGIYTVVDWFSEDDIRREFGLVGPPPGKLPAVTYSTRE